MKARRLALWGMLLGLAGCSTVYYGALDKLGVHKRDILVDRVKEARDAQQGARQQFVSALEQFKSVVEFKGGDLEKEYNRLNAVLQKSEARAAAVRDRIRSVEDVAGALFKEWRQELKQYSSSALRASSESKYEATRDRYDELMDSMKAAEAKLEPVLVPLRDQVLFLKHNLNAKAIAGLSGELVSVQANVDRLIRDMDAAIARADAFITTLQEP